MNEKHKKIQGKYRWKGKHLGGLPLRHHGDVLQIGLAHTSNHYDNVFITAQTRQEYVRMKDRSR